MEIQVLMIDLVCCLDFELRIIDWIVWTLGNNRFDANVETIIINRVSIEIVLQHMWNIVCILSQKRKIQRVGTYLIALELELAECNLMTMRSVFQRNRAHIHGQIPIASRQCSWTDLDWLLVPVCWKVYRRSGSFLYPWDLNLWLHILNAQGLVSGKERRPSPHVRLWDGCEIVRWIRKGHGYGLHVE